MNRRSCIPLLGAAAFWRPGAAGADAVADNELPAAKPVPEMQAVPLPDNAVSFQHRRRELTRLHASPAAERPFLFPITGPGGVSLTRMGHPRDPVSHSHHNSVWISHQNAGGLNFWEDRNAKGSGSIRCRSIDRLWDSAECCGCALTLQWLRDEDGAVLLHEKRLIEVRRPDAGGNWLLAVAMEFSAAGPDPVEFAQSFFGLVGVRMAKTIGVNDGGGRILNSSGQRNEPDAFRQPARWVDYSGPVTEKEAGGAALFDHPENPGHPALFHIRNDGWMGACSTGKDAVSVAPGKPITWRYGLWAHTGVPNREALEAAWQDYRALGELGSADRTKP